MKSIYIPVKAEAHTPPYKIHKYFARRPWNVFNQLVDIFSEEGDIILDPFCGGGVTIYEGLKKNRKVIGCDLNPLSIFVVKNMVKKINDQEKLVKAFKLIEGYIENLYSGFDTFSNNKEKIRIEWSEVAFVVSCYYCGKDIILSNENKLKNGIYRCGNKKCLSHKSKNEGVEVKNCNRIGFKYLYNCGHDLNGKKVYKQFDLNEEKQLKKHVELLKAELKKRKINIPKDKIPLNWDRQLEDQLAKKGIIHFQDLFTERNLLINLLILNFIQSMKSDMSFSEYGLVRMAFSSTIKDTNIMSFTNDMWQSGKPTTWSKHAYWVPSQFCEVNIEDSFKKAKKKIISAVDFNDQFDFEIIESSKYSELAKNKNLLLWNKSVESLNLPSNSVDAIVTDPPYGSNVQYLELSHFWYPWNKDMYGDVQPDFKLEAISNRKKNFDGSKSMYNYEDNLYKVFSKSFDALKPNRCMVLTFNNKNISAWLALLFSIFRSGFVLDDGGIYFQDGVKNYRQTAHTKYDGSPYGDFIYVFKKVNNKKPRIVYKDEKAFWSDLDSIFKKYFERDKSEKNKTIREMFLEAIPIIESFSKTYLTSQKHGLYEFLKKDYFDHFYE